MRYKTGDKAIVRSDLIVGDEQYFNDDNDEWNTVTEEMAKLAGQEVTIIYDEYFDQYMVAEDRHHYHWTDSMFEQSIGAEIDVSDLV